MRGSTVSHDTHVTTYQLLCPLYQVMGDLLDSGLLFRRDDLLTGNQVLLLFLLRLRLDEGKFVNTGLILPNKRKYNLFITN